MTGRVLACISSWPGQCGRSDGYILEGKELEFYLRKIKSTKALYPALVYHCSLRSGPIALLLSILIPGADLMLCNSCSPIHHSSLIQMCFSHTPQALHLIQSSLILIRNV